MSGDNNTQLAKKAGFSSPIAMVISLIASSVGTGNIWRFPRVCAANGGGAFIIAYMIIMLVIIIPVMMGEHAMGRATRHGAPGAFRDFAGKNFTWMGTVVVIVLGMTMAYYSAVLAWVLYYFGLSVTNGYAGVDKVELFASVSNHNIITVILFVLILAASVYICYNGVKFIEKANNVMLPVLLGCLIISAVAALTREGSTTGLNYLYAFELSDFANAKLWLEALIQCMWSAGAGFGLVITLSVFTKKNSDVALTSTINGMGDCFCALLAGLAVIPAIFTFTTPEAAIDICNSGNNGLVFIALTGMYDGLPLGNVLGAIFFIALLMAGISSNVCHVLIVSVPFADSGIDKKKATIGIFIFALLLGLPSAWNSNFLSNQDWVVAIMFVVGAIFSCIAFMKFGADKLRTKFLNNKYTGIHIGKWWNFSVTILAPIAAAIMLIVQFVESLGWGEVWWNPFGISNIGTVLFQGGIIVIFAIIFNKKIAGSIKHKYFDGENFPDIPDNGYSA